MMPANVARLSRLVATVLFIVLRNINVCFYLSAVSAAIEKNTVQHPSFDLFSTTEASSSSLSPTDEADQNHLLTFLRQIVAPSSSSANKNDAFRNRTKIDKNSPIIDMFTQFFRRNNLSALAVEKAFNNASYALDKLLTVNRNINNIPTTHHQLDVEKESQAVRELFAMPAPARTIVQIAYVTLVVFAFIGNCTVIVVYCVAKHWRHDISVFHIQLAVADMMLALVCIPFTMQQVLDHFWTWPEAMCSPILCLQLFSVCMSIFTLVCIGIDRLQFVWHPLRPRLSSGASGKLTMLIVAIVSVGFACVQLPFIDVVKTNFADSKAFKAGGTTSPNVPTLNQCKLKDERESFANIAVATISLTYILPLLFLMIVYACIGRAVWTRQPPGERLSHVAREHRALAEKRNIVKSLILIVAFFALARLPLHALVLLFTLAPSALLPLERDMSDVREQSAMVAHMRFIYLPCHFVAMTSTCINPAVYAFMHTTFRHDCKRIWREICNAFRRHLGRSINDFQDHSHHQHCNNALSQRDRRTSRNAEATKCKLREVSSLPVTILMHTRASA